MKRAHTFSLVFHRPKFVKIGNKFVKTELDVYFV